MNYIIQLTNKKTGQIFTKEVYDLNEGEKLYYKFPIDLSEMENGEYDLELTESGQLIIVDTLYIGDYQPNSLQYKRGDNTFIEIILDAKLQDKEVEITEIETVVKTDEDYDGFKEVIIDATPLYENAYEMGNKDGYETGIKIQKELLETLTVTENGTYTKEDGYNEVIVNVPDLNGDYQTGFDEGYSNGYADGIDYASENAGEIVAANAIDLVATEFRTYYTKFSDNIVNPNPVTGIYPDGEKFYNLADIKNIIYNTSIIPNENTKLEFWFIPDGDRDSDGRAGLVYTNVDNSNGWGVNQNTAGNQSYYASLGTYNNLNFPLEDFTLNHIEMSYADGLIVNGEKVGDFTDYGNINQTLLINGVLVKNYSPDGSYGMIKITQDGIINVIIPTEDGLKNITTDEMLEVVYNEGTYKYINNDPIVLDNLIKSVNVQPKVDVKKYGIKLGYSTFSVVPDVYDFSNVTDMSWMFYSCKSLKSISMLDTSNVTDMNRMFYSCDSLQSISMLDTSNVTDMSYMFYGDNNLISLPALNVPKVTNMGSYFRTGGDNLIDVGGWINLNCDWNDNYGLVRCTKLSYQSCINILNGLADVTELGGRTLKVHSNFLTTVGDEISIATNKGWVLSA